MSKISLVLADCDEDYVSSLEQYIMRHHASGFEVYSFTDPDVLKDFLCGRRAGIDVLLAGDGFTKDMGADKAAKLVMLLDDGKPAGKEKGFERLNRYQHAEKLVTDIHGKYSSLSPENHLPSGRSRTHVTCFISPEGGAGKSTVSSCCSILSSRRGLKSFYLNLEHPASTQMYFQGISEHSFSSAIYYLKSGEGGLEIRLSGIKCTDSSKGVDFFLPPEKTLEVSCLERAELERLIESFRSSSNYDSVFIDLPAGIDGFNAAVMNACDKIVCISGTGAAPAHKLGQLEKELDWLEKKYVKDLTTKIIYVINDHCNKGLSPAYEFGRKESAVMLGYCGKLAEAADPAGEVCRNTGFLSGIARLLETLDPRYTLNGRSQEGGTDFDG